VLAASFASFAVTTGVLQTEITTVAAATAANTIAIGTIDAENVTLESKTANIPLVKVSSVAGTENTTIYEQFTVGTILGDKVTFNDLSSGFNFWKLINIK